MPRFFLNRSQIDTDNSTVTILGDDAHHIARSLRMAVGQHITVCDGEGHEYECEIVSFCDDESVSAKILSSGDSDNEPPFFAYLYQALPKGDKLDSIIQKAVECGVYEIVLFESERCVVRIKSDSEDKKRERRCRIALEASKQSGRSAVPAVRTAIGFDEAIEEAAKADIPLFCYEGESLRSLSRALDEFDEKFENNTRKPTVSIVVGSEGGFSPSEAEKAKKAGMIPVGLGKRILRTETAASFVLACLVYRYEL